MSIAIPPANSPVHGPINFWRWATDSIAKRLAGRGESRPMRRILLIDDDTSLLRAYQRVLASENEVVCAGGGREAIRWLEADALFDLVICDLVMPRVDGNAVLAWIATNRPQLAPRVVIHTASTDLRMSVRDIVRRTHARVVEKPLGAASLCALVERISPIASSKN